MPRRGPGATPQLSATGGKETARVLKQLVAEIDSSGAAPVVGSGERAPASKAAAARDKAK